MTASTTQPTWFHRGLLLPRGTISDFHVAFTKYQQHLQQQQQQHQQHQQQHQQQLQQQQHKKHFSHKLSTNKEPTQQQQYQNQQQQQQRAALACEGGYLFLQNSKGLFKVGSGYHSTIKVPTIQHPMHSYSAHFRALNEIFVIIFPLLLINLLG